MAALSQPFNAGRLWTPEDTETLRHLTREGVAPDLIADRLGRSLGALSHRAVRIGFNLGKHRAGRAAEPGLARPFGSATRADKPLVGWVTGDALAPLIYVQVRREGRSPLPWAWEIRRDGGLGALRCSLRGYRSAEEAWEAGRGALARWRHSGPR